MAESTYCMSDYTFTRLGLDPMKIKGNLTSDNTILHLDAAIGFLHGATKALELESQNCPSGSERAGKVANLFTRVRDIQKEIEALSRM